MSSNKVTLTPEHFKSYEKDIRQAEKISRKSLNYWEDVWIRLKSNKIAITAIVVLSVLILMAIFAPIFSSYEYQGQVLEDKNQPPSLEHWFGTDELGRDMFVRTWYGARISLFIGVVAALIDLTIGVIYGSIAGYFGRKVDEVMMRICDVLYGIPYLLVVIMLMVVLPQGLGTMILALTVTGWITMARIVRGQILQLKEQEFVLSARSLGSSTKRLLFRHLIPNAMGPIIVTLTLTIPLAIFTEAFLSFLGLGVQAPIASWGTMAENGIQALRYFPWRIFFPAFFISLTILAFNILGDGLRDALDPRLRK
ncbi:ABC transporter permease [Chengkuizengella axinellae]|uniref:ABC transporter permease n=1 Tax=Chengkuizengella axinellae TaxID=3064388 RepID=A0ABT9IVI2_9BACL|nr:ABC transporter permease [Chengkuizengella sp. 2205SS18-9]MDP5273348.1 ABC transporter permease [Chengkuizengella sp. 2205SS18-9]